MKELWAWLVIALLACFVVGLHVLVDPRSYDVSQIVRLVALMTSLLVFVPVVLLVPPVARGIDWRRLRSPIVRALALYLVACWLSLPFATNVSAGFTDGFRTLGALMVTGIAALVLPLDTRWKPWLLQAAVVSTTIALAIALPKVFPLLLDGLPARRDLEMAFLDGLMSNVNLFAAWLVMLLPWCVVGGVVLSRWWRVAAILVATANALVVVLLQSRAAWLGLIAASVITGGLMLAFRQSLGASDRLCRIVKNLFVVGALTGLGFIALALTDSSIGEAIRARVISRPHQAGGPTDGGRMMVWGLTCRMIADQAWTGVGAGNFPIRLHDYFGPDAAGNVPDFATLASDNWIQPHNDFLWIFAEKGFLGILSFIAIFFFAARTGLAVLQRPRTSVDAWLSLAGLSGLVAYVAISLFDFPLDRVSHQVLLAMHLAVLTILAYEPREEPGARSIPGWLVAPPLMAALALGLCYAWAAWDQEREVMIARRAQHEKNWRVMRDAARQASTPWKTLDPLAVPVALLEGLAEVQLGDLPAALGSFERAYDANPNRLAVLQNLGAAYAQSGRLDEAVAAFAIAAHRYPGRLDVRHNLASALIDAGRFEEAIAILEDIPEPLRTEAIREALDHAREQATAAADQR